MNGISVNAVVATLSSTTFILPVNNNMEITVAGGAVLDLPYAIKFQAGAGLIIEEGASVEGLPSSGVEIPVMENQSNSEASTIAGLKEDFNALLAKLKSAGLMEADAEETEN